MVENVRFWKRKVNISIFFLLPLQVVRTLRWRRAKRKLIEAMQFEEVGNAVLYVLSWKPNVRDKRCVFFPRPQYVSTHPT